jgi:hypothetical protein
MGDCVLFTFAVVIASLVMHAAGGVKTVVSGPIKLVGMDERGDVVEAPVIGIKDEMESVVES